MAPQGRLAADGGQPRSRQGSEEGVPRTEGSASVREHEGRRAQGDAGDRRAGDRDDRASRWRRSGRGPHRSRPRMLASAGVRPRRAVVRRRCRCTGARRGPAERGRGVVMRGDPWSSPTEVTPDGFNVRTTRARVRRRRLRGASRHRRLLQRRRPAALPARDDGATPVPITPETVRDASLRRRAHHGRRRAGGSACGSDMRVPAGRAEVVNELVVLPLDGSVQPRGHRLGPRLLCGRPRLARRLAARRSSRGTCRGCRGTAVSCSSATSASRRFGVEPSPRGRRRRRGIDLGARLEPGGRPALRERPDRAGGTWNASVDGERQALRPSEAEFGFPQWVFGSRSFGFLDDGRIACWYERSGTCRCWRCSIRRPVSCWTWTCPHTALCIGARAMAVDGSDDRVHRRRARPPRRARLAGLHRRDRSRCCASAREMPVDAGVRVGAVARSSSRPMASARRSPTSTRRRTRAFAGPPGSARR